MDLVEGKKDGPCHYERALRCSVSGWDHTAHWKAQRRGANPSLEGATGRVSFCKVEMSKLRPQGWTEASQVKGSGAGGGGVGSG